MRLPGTLDCKGSRSILKAGRGWRRRLNSCRPRYDLLEERALLTAYVTPIPKTRKDRFDERDWQRVRQAMLSVFGNN